MSVFTRIDPDHPLTQAARSTNAYSEEHGLPATLDWLGMNVSADELFYLAEQRALRAVAAASIGLNMGHDRGLDDATANAIVQTPLWRDMRLLLLGCIADGIAIGWKAHELQDADQREDERP